MKSALSKITLEKADKKDSKEIADLIYITEPEPELEWGYGSEQEQKKLLEELMKTEDNRFSLENILSARQDGKLVGMVLLIEGKNIDRLTVNSGKQVLKEQKGISNKLWFIYDSIKDFLLEEECKQDELYISNIAIKPEYRGHGYAKIMINKIYKIARKKGYKKVSLIAKNDKLIHFYESIGFDVVNRKLRRMVTIL